MGELKMAEVELGSMSEMMEKIIIEKITDINKTS
jgi:hypothetical protein